MAPRGHGMEFSVAWQLASVLSASLWVQLRRRRRKTANRSEEGYGEQINA